MEPLHSQEHYGGLETFLRKYSDTGEDDKADN
jgi:hypothetical protein